MCALLRTFISDGAIPMTPDIPTDIERLAKRLTHYGQEPTLPVAAGTGVAVPPDVLHSAAAAITSLLAERDALRQTLADLASSDPFAAHAEGDHAMAYENNAENLRLRARITSLLGVVEDAETLLRVIGKRGLYPAEDDWILIVQAADALRDSTAALSKEGEGG